MTKEDITLERILALYSKLQYKLPSLINEAQLIVIRTNDTDTTVYNDWAVVLYKIATEGGVKLELSKPNAVTSNAGSHYLMNLMNSKGTAIIPLGQYINYFREGLHKGDAALVQATAITVLRDGNKNNQLDFRAWQSALEFKKEPVNVKDTGIFGLNYHHAGKNVISKLIGKWSAGCIVNPNFAEYTKQRELLSNSPIERICLTMISENELLHGNA